MPDEPDCDYDGCTDRGWARYRHLHRETWIDTCRRHTPRVLFPTDLDLCFHTRVAECYPATEPAEVR